MKKVICLILALGMIVSCVPCIAAGYEAEIGGITYTIENGEATVTDCKWEVSGDVIIESTVEGCPVTKIGERAFENCGQIVRVRIPDSVTSIGRAAFYRCVELKYVLGMNNVETIGESAFHGCLDIESFTVSGKVSRIEFGTFMNMSSLKEVVIGDNLTFIDDSAFRGCHNLESVVIGDKVKEIGTQEIGEANEDFTTKTYFDRTPVFEGCNNLKTITLGKSIENIYPNTFSNIAALTDINVSEENPYYKSIDGVLFTKDGKKLVCYPIGKSEMEYTVPDGVEEVCDKAFYRCKLEKVNVPESLEKIGAYNGVFDDALVTQRAVTRGKQGDIEWVYENSTITFTGKGVLTDTFSGSVVYPTWETARVEKMVVNEGITHIDGMAGHENLNEVVLPKTLEKIATRAFAGCTSLEKIVIPENVSLIDVMAFDECENLKEVTVTSKVPMRIERSAFDIADGSVIHLPETVYEIHEHAFTDTFAVMHGGYGCLDEDCDITIVAPKGSYAYNWAVENDFKVTDSKSEVKMIDGVLCVRRDIFFEKMAALCEALGGTCSISRNTLAIMKNGNYLVVMGFEVSYKDSGVVVNENIYMNDEYVRLPLGGIKAVLGYELENRADAIDRVLMLYDFVLEETDENVIIKGLKKDVENLVIPAEINGKKVQIAQSAFYDNNTVVSLTIEDGISVIPEFAFYGCDNLKSADIGSVKKIDRCAFAYCKKLSEIGLEEVEEMGESAFEACSSLESVTLLSLKKWSGITDDMLDGMTIPRWYHERLYMHYSNLVYSPFYNCTGLKKATVRFPETDSESFPTLFTNCANLEKVVFLSFTATPSKAEFYSVRLANHRFDDADRLTERAKVTIYSDSIKAKEYAKGNGFAFESEVGKANDIFVENGKMQATEKLFTLSKEELTEYKETVEEIVLADGVTEIPEAFFENWTKLRRVEFPAGLEKIGKRAFAGCTNLYSVSFTRVKYASDMCLEVGEEAFSGCTGLRTVTLYIDVKIGDRAFENCRALSKVSISDTAEIVFGEGVFNGCKSLSILDLYNVKFEGLYPIAQPGKESYVNTIVLCNGFEEELLATDEDGNVIDRLPESVRDINVIGDNTKYSSLAGCVYTKDMKTLCYCPKGKDMSAYVFPDGADRVYAGALKAEDYKYLPDNMTIVIGNYAQVESEPEESDTEVEVEDSHVDIGNVDLSGIEITTSILSEPENGPDNLFDNDFVSYCVLYVKDEEKPEYMEFDLGEVKNVEQLALAFRDATTRTTYFDVRVSSDGVNFETVIEKRGSNGDTNGLQYFDIDRDARYVRVYGYSNTFNQKWVSITEAAIYVNK